MRTSRSTQRTGATTAAGSLAWSATGYAHPSAPPSAPSVFKPETFALQDEALGNITSAVKAKPGMWEETLLLLTTDNVRTDGSCCSFCFRWHLLPFC